MESEIKQIIYQIDSLSDQKKADWWNNYLKDTIKFIGVSIPDIRKILKTWNKKNKTDVEVLIKIADELIKYDIAEYKLAGILIFQEFLLNNIDDVKIINHIEKLFELKYIYDWNTCDWLCVRILTPIIDKANLNDINKILNWYSKKYLWQARASIVSFAQCKSLKLNYKKLLKPMKNLIERKEKFSKSAVGWVLREISKFDVDFVLEFISTYLQYLNKDVLLNSLKYLDKKLVKQYMLKLKEIN